MTSTNTPTNPTEAFLDSLLATVASGHESTVAALKRGATDADPAIALPTLSAAALLTTHSDHATDPRVAGLIAALATDAGRAALDVLLPSAVVGETPLLDEAMRFEDKVEVLRAAVDLGALTAYANPPLSESIASYLDALDVHVLAYPSAHEDLGAPAQLLRNVAAFGAGHPLSVFLDGVVVNEAMPLFAFEAAETLALVAKGVARHTDRASTWSRWRRTFTRFFEDLGKEVSGLIAMDPPSANVAYAAGLDDIDEHRFGLDDNDDDEVNVVFRGGEVILEWQGVSEAPSTVDIAATTVLGAAEATTTIDGEERRRWVLAVPPGEAETTVTLRFPSGRTWVLTLPGSEEA